MPTIQPFEDESCARLYPLHLLTGVAGLRLGPWTQQERWDAVARDIPTAVCSDGPLEVLARWVPGADAAAQLSRLRPGQRLMHGVQWLAGSRDSQADPVEWQGTPVLMDSANSLFSELGKQIQRDLPSMRAAWNLQPWTPPAACFVHGTAAAVEAAPDADIRAASIDTSHGPVVIGPGATVHAGAHLVGPLVIHEGAQVQHTAVIKGPTLIGPHCKVGGEVSNVSFQGWSNKAHDGFLGNSVIGRWCNLGAGTTASNLKNNYSTVRQWSDEAQAFIDSGLQFCGVLMGDHSKCGIGTTFNTGTSVGPASVLFDTGFPPKHIPPFSWLDVRNGLCSDHDLPRMLSTAEAVMSRRGVAMTEADKAKLSALHAESTGTPPRV